MPVGRHRKSTRRNLRRLSAAAGVTVIVAMAIPIAAVSQVTPADEPMVQTALQAPEAARADLRAASRSSHRLELPPSGPRPVVKATEPAVQLSPRWTTTRLNVWSRPDEGSRLLTVLDTAVKVPMTGSAQGVWAEIEQGDRTAWVHKAYLV
ncbi:MAG: SH3 domain-containing protein, partial [Spirochaetaceae bacterium]|nr:SH3 domain-containing protein [Spirochaetaceae bacterium]